MKLNLCAAVAVLVTMLLARPADAAQTATSTIAQIKVLERSHPNHKLFHGAVWLEYDKAKHNYRWGGSHCGGAGLSDGNVALLFAAFRARYNVTLDYRVRRYEKRSYRCITGFTIARS